MEWLKVLVNCKILRIHYWTCAAEQGIPATQKQLAAGVDGFFDYATMYCKDCGKISDVSTRYPE